MTLPAPPRNPWDGLKRDLGLRCPRGCREFLKLSCMGLSDQISRLTEVLCVRLCLPAFRKLTSVLCSIRRFAAGQQRRMTGAAVSNDNVASSRSDPDVSDQNAICSERLGSCSRCHPLSAVAPVRRLSDDTRGRCVRHDNSPRWQGERPRTFFGPIHLQSSSQPPISEPPVRSNGWAALSLLVRAHRPTGLVPFTGT